jgi:hypothetical protein
VVDAHRVEVAAEAAPSSEHSRALLVGGGYSLDL